MNKKKIVIKGKVGRRMKINERMFLATLQRVDTIKSSRKEIMAIEQPKDEETPLNQ